MDYLNPPRPRNATTRELTVLAEAVRAAHFVADSQHVRAIEDAVKLIVKLIDQRTRRIRFEEHYDPTHED